MTHFWDDDDLLEKAKSLLAESPDELKARLVAQVMRLQQEAGKHLEAAADERATIMIAHSAYPPTVMRIAKMLIKHPYFVEPVTQLLETKLQNMIDSLAAEGENPNDNQ